MNAKKRVILNSAVLYAKIIASMSLTLVSVPMILKSMGASDYGLYNLMAGVVGMLAFLNNSLTVSSQRYLSVSMGKGNNHEINLIYNTSFFLHLVLGIGVILLLECGSLFIDRLNIEPDRIQVANIIYQLLIATTFIRIVSVPYDAIINAHEDMVTFAVIEIIDSLLLFVIAVSLQFVPYDKLVFYGGSMCLVSFVNIILKSGWCSLKYRKYRINIKKYRKELLLKEMFGFAGWNMFGGLSVIGRNQGVAVIINIFLGTIVNAAYGLANQINGALSSFSGTFQRAINPQLMKSEGMKDRERLFRITIVTSKYSVIALSFFAIPLIITMPDVLQIWLHGDIPIYTMELSRCILIMTIVYQFSTGIMSAIQAAGDIKKYQLTMGSIILMNLPLSYLFLKLGFPAYSVTIGFVLLEILSLVVRIRMSKLLIGMPSGNFVKKVIVPTLLYISLSFVCGSLASVLCQTALPRIIITGLTSCGVFFLMFCFFDLSKSQRVQILKAIKVK